jgi:hypothetical protein
VFNQFRKHTKSNSNWQKIIDEEPLAVISSEIDGVTKKGFLRLTKVLKLVKENPHILRVDGMQEAIERLISDPDDVKEYKDFMEDIAPLIAMAEFSPLTRTQPTQDELGPVTEDHIKLFSVKDTGAIPYLHKLKLCNHLILSGYTDSGKTTALKRLLLNLSGKVTVIVFDIAKQLRHLATINSLRGIIRPWRWEELRLAALQPSDGVRLSRHINNLIENFSSSYHLIKSLEFGKKTLKMLYADFGIYEAREGQIYPTLQDWYEYLSSPQVKSLYKKYDYKTQEHISNFSSSLSDLIDSTEELFNACYSEFLDELFAKGTINLIEVDGLSLQAYLFLVRFISDWVHLKRLQNEESF